jgi:hypothetical protein
MLHVTSAGFDMNDNDEDELEVKMLRYFFIVAPIFFAACIFISQKISSQYIIVSTDVELSGEVSEFEVVQRGVRIQFTNHKKYFIPRSINNSYQRPSLVELITGGDLISKKKGSNTLYVRRRSLKKPVETYVFVVGKEMR